MKQIIYFILLIIIVSCSSQPKQIKTPMVQEADNMYALGKRLSAQGKLRDALKSYTLASDRYALIDNLDGYILARIALVGTLAKLGETASFLEVMEYLEHLIRTEKPQYIENLLLLNTEIAFMEKNYEQVLDISNNYKSQDIVIETQILSLRLMSRIKTAQNGKREYDKLAANTKRLRKAYRKGKMNETGVYGYANFVLGYHHAYHQEWNKAKKFFATSLTVDKRNDNSLGTAQNLYMLGLVFDGLNETDKAITHYHRALKIYTLSNDKEMIKTIEAKVKRNTND